MKRHYFVLLAIVLSIGNSFSQSVKWTAKPFDHNIFIENKGQFDKDINSSDKILYQAQLGDVKAYFTGTGIIYRYDKYPVKNEAAEHDGDKEEIKPETHFVSASWVGANPGVAIETDGEQSYYYTYPDGLNRTIRAGVFKTITYNNMYPGIDIEYYFPGGKSGIEYNIVVHPGADVSVIKLKYNGVEGMSVDGNGNVVIKSAMGDITDHSPVTYQQHWEGGPGIYNGCHKIQVKSHYGLKNMEESFSIDEPYDNTQKLIIDPWTTNPNFTEYNRAYKIDYDSSGNVYAYGSANPYQLAKFNSAGTLQWIFNATTFVFCYGDFTVDKATGTSYLTEGYDGAGAKALKVNNAGSAVATFSGTTNMDEFWRVKYLANTNQLLIGGGGTAATSQAGLLDTAFGTFTPLNVMNVTTNYHDVCLFAMDPSGTSCYICSTSDAIDTGNANNFLFKLPVPALTPAIFSARDGFHFLETGSTNYTGNGTGGGFYANGYNGIAVSSNWLYLYDGATLERVDKNTGAILQKGKISNRIANGSIYYNLYSGGLAADSCDNVFVGYDSVIEMYNSSLVPISTITLTDTVYDISLGKGVLYSCGAGFVTVIAINDSCELFTSVMSPAKNNSTVKVYPNPGAGVFNFDIQGINGKLNVDIYNVLGEKIYSAKNQSSTNGYLFSVDLGNKSSGIYLYRVTSETGECVGSGKLIVE